MTQTDLFAPRTRHRRNDRPTAVIAAYGTIEFKTTIQRTVFQELMAAGPVGLTDEELTDRLRMRGSTARTRRAELTTMGHVVENGRRPLASGREGTVWIARVYAR
ncbi:MAG: hypothetical protein ACK53W_13410 [Gemmatimonadota bacterium]